jgi:uncharacterized protein YjgD (DUF1641 family)
MEATREPTQIAVLIEKIDTLTAMVDAQRRRQLEMEELQHDLLPIVNHAIKLSIDELAEIGNDFKLEDLLYLLKRLLRNTHLLIGLMDQLEAAAALGAETRILSKQVFNSSVETLDHMEREGYFAFARGSWYILEQIVSEFSEEDVRALGDNVVTILKTVRTMTQPEIMTLANTAVQTLSQDDDRGDKTSAWALLRELNDPKVRKGLVRMLNLVKVLADQPAVNNH